MVHGENLIAAKMNPDLTVCRMEKTVKNTACACYSNAAIIRADTVYILVVILVIRDKHVRRSVDPK